MSVCKLCGGIGHHKSWCWGRGEVEPEQPRTRIEWTGNIEVHHPVKQSA